MTFVVPKVPVGGSRWAGRDGLGRIQNRADRLDAAELDLCVHHRSLAPTIVG
jgi:hypothetical protein